MEEELLGPLLLERDDRRGEYLELDGPAGAAVYWFTVISDPPVYGLSDRVPIYLLGCMNKVGPGCHLSSFVVEKQSAAQLLRGPTGSLSIRTCGQNHGRGTFRL